MVKKSNKMSMNLPDADQEGNNSNPSNVTDGIGGKQITAGVNGEKFAGKHAFRSIDKEEKSPSFHEIVWVQDTEDDVTNP